MTKTVLLLLSILGTILSASNLAADEKTVYISSETRPCSAGVMDKECLLVKWTKDQKDWEYFYDDIEGFTYEKGNEYELVISVEEVENPPADASSLKYKLIRQVSKKKVKNDSPNPPGDAGGWSEATRDLEARVTLVEKPAFHGTRSLVPSLELRHVGNSGSPLEVCCDRGHVKFELVDADGQVVRDGSSLDRSGPHADPGTVSLPFDGSIRIGMHCSNWGVPKDAAAMISTDSGAWVLTNEEKGKVFLRATLEGEKAESDSNQTWHGVIELPAVKVDWSK